MKRSRHAAAPYIAAVVLALALITVRLTVGHRAETPIQVGILLLFVALSGVDGVRRWQGKAQPRWKPSDFLLTRLLLVALTLPYVVVLNRSASPVLATACVSVLLVLAGAYVVLYWAERRRNRLRSRQSAAVQRAYRRR